MERSVCDQQCNAYAFSTNIPHFNFLTEVILGPNKTRNVRDAVLNKSVYDMHREENEIMRVSMRGEQIASIPPQREFPEKFENP